MTLWPATHPRIAAAAALALLIGGLGLALQGPTSPLAGQLVRASYDAYFAWFNGATPPPTNSPVMLVYLDLASYRNEGLDPSRPWPRAQHARLLHRLTQAGARAVVFDIVFDAPGADAEADQRLAEAMRRNGRTVLAGELAASSHDTGEAEWARASQLALPLGPFLECAAAWGIGNLAVEEDFTVRRHFEGRGEEGPSLAVATARWLQVPAATNPPASARWFRYYGKPFSLPHVSVSQAIDRTALSDEVFRDRIVVVGARPMAGTFRERRDEFRSPLRSWRERDLFMPGAEVHATQILNLLRQDWLVRVPSTGEVGILLAVALLGGALVGLRPLAAVGVALLLAALLTGGAIVAFHQAGVWWAWLIPVGVQLPVAAGGAVLFHSVEWYRARRRFEAARRLAETRLREQAALLDRAQDAILVQDLAGRVTYANPRAQTLFGEFLNALPPTASAMSCPVPTEPWLEARRRALERGEWHGELRWIDSTHRTLTLECRWTLIRDDAGQPRSLLQIVHDVTDQRQLQAEALRMQRLEGIGALASGMAHDLNNALAPVLMGTQLLRRTATDDEQRRILSLMEASTRRGAEMIRQVLLFARGHQGETQRLDLRGLVREMERLARDTFPRNVEVTAFVPEDLWPVHGNPTQLHQVLLNLCVNARDAMPDGGKLSLAADNVVLTPEETRELPGAQPGQYVSLMVVDTGVGIPPDVLPRIFEPFYTTKPEGKGSGLGLSTTSRIVKAHGGFVGVKGAPGGGTAFEVMLPRADTRPVSESSLAAEDAPRGRSELILVAEDEQAVREVLRRVLEDHGYRVATAANGAEAVASFREHITEVALVLADRDMPALDGLAALTVMREAKPDLRWFLMSGDVPAETAQSHEEDLTARLLRKPLDRSELLRAVAQALG